jgi:alpha-L-fucosidase 2
VLSVKKTPELIEPIKKVLEQRGDGACGWSRAWKMNLWSRLYDGERALSIYKGYLKEQSYLSLFAKCGEPFNIDGSLGQTAGITEMLVQSHEGVIDLLPAVPNEWSTGQFGGVRVRGGFELNMIWKDKKITTVEITSRAGKPCRINAGDGYKVTQDGKEIASKTNDDGSIEFDTIEGSTYLLSAL